MAHHHHHGPSHGAPREGDRRGLIVALVLLLALMAGELVVGVLASSLALLADAAHLLTDAAALMISLAAMRLAARPARGAMTFGSGRVEILSAQINGATLLVLAGVIVYEGIRRLIDPPAVDALPVLIVALVGAGVNVVAVRAVAGAGRESLNVEGSYQHLITDLYAFLATAAAALVILLTGFTRADALASLLVAALMLYSAYGLLKASGRIFLEAAPEGIDPDAIGRTLAAQPGVTEVHDLHVWEVTSGFPAFSAHVLVAVGDDCHGVRRQLEKVLRESFGIEHTTMQVDHASEGLLTVEVPSRYS